MAIVRDDWWIFYKIITLNGGNRPKCGWLAIDVILLWEYEVLSKYAWTQVSQPNTLKWLVWTGICSKFTIFSAIVSTTNSEYVFPIIVRFQNSNGSKSKSIFSVRFQSFRVKTQIGYLASTRSSTFNKCDFIIRIVLV